MSKRRKVRRQSKPALVPCYVDTARLSAPATPHGNRGDELTVSLVGEVLTGRKVGDPVRRHR